MCFGSDPVGSQLAPQQILLRQKGALGTKSVQDLEKQLDEIERDPHYLAHHYLGYFPPEYKDAFTTYEIGVRLACVACVILAIATYVLFLSGHFWTFPQDFMHWIHTINPLNAAIGGGIAFVLIAGGSWVIHRARTKEDRLLKSGRGTLEEIDPHLETVCVNYISKKGSAHYTHLYIDHSTKKGKGAEKVYLYNIEEPGHHYSVSFIVTFIGTPVYLVGTVVYNVFRAVIAPFYVLFQYLRERCVGTQVSNAMAPGAFSKRLFLDERSFELVDIPKEMIRSIARVLQAPFYALAFFMAGLYSWVNPMGGRKLGAAIERDWNDEVSLAEGYWSVKGEQKLFKPEGGGGPNGLGRNGFYLAGCWQPVGIAEYQDGKLVKAYYLPKAIDPAAGMDYVTFFRSDLEQHVNDNQQAINSLVLEAEQIQAELDSMD